MAALFAAGQVPKSAMRKPTKPYTAPQWSWLCGYPVAYFALAAPAQWSWITDIGQVTSTDTLQHPYISYLKASRTTNKLPSCPVLFNAVFPIHSLDDQRQLHNSLMTWDTVQQRHLDS